MTARPYIGKLRPTPAGYTVTANGSPGWLPTEAYQYPHQFAPAFSSPTARATAIERHAARLASNRTVPDDWPPALVQYAQRRRGDPMPWRVVPLTNTGARIPARMTRHRTHAEATGALVALYTTRS